jgi:membrane protein DedA with SNARE-associated domain
MEAWLTQYGYGGLFALLMFGIVGLPVPDETLLTLSGYLVQQGTLRWLPTLLAALGGSVCGITVSYCLGRTAGRAALRKYGRWLHADDDAMERALVWFRRTGTYGLTLGYFVPGFRHVVAIAAGSTGLSWTTFAGFAYTGGLLWTATFVSLGYYVGAEWTAVLTTLHQRAVAGLAVAGLAVVVGWLWKKRGHASR